jgi:hypothetical protein
MMIDKLKRTLLLGALATLGNAPLAFSAELDDIPPTESSLNLRGFGTFGVARSSSDRAEFVRDLSQPGGIKNHWSGRIDSVLGVQANWQATPTVELVGQAVTRWHYDRSRDPEVMWAFAKWEPDARVSLRAGRIGADFMMLADSRLVGYSYLPVRPPSDFFGPLFFSHFDGADATVTLPLGGGLVRGKLFSGETQEKTSGAPGIWDTSGSPVLGFVLDYQNGPWLLRANMASIRFSSNINFKALTDPLRLIGTTSTLAAVDVLTTKDTTTRFYSLGVVYDEGPLQVQGMINHIHHETGVFQNSDAVYLLAGYRLGTVTPYAGISRWMSNYKDYTTGLPSGVGFDVLIGGFDYVMHASTANQTTYTLGSRWDVYRNTAIKLQWDAIRGHADSRFPFARTDADWNGRTDVLSLSLDFVF